MGLDGKKGNNRGLLEPETWLDKARAEEFDLESKGDDKSLPLPCL
jgi:hypothetical protein